MSKVLSGSTTIREWLEILTDYEETGQETVVIYTVMRRRIRA
jgi:hypothetical protein